MLTRRPSLLLVPVLAMVASCVFVVGEDGGVHSLWRHGVRGSGVRAEVHRELPDFHAVEFDVAGEVVVRVGEPASVHLSGDDNLLPEIETTVRNGVLHVDLARSCDFRCDLQVVIGTPSLERFDLEGSGDVEIAGLAGHEVELVIEGSGSIQARGATHRLVGAIEGSGDLLLAELGATRADLSIEGSGSMDVSVAEALHYSIAGSGSIAYRGDARVSGSVDGSGSIVRR